MGPVRHGPRSPTVRAGRKIGPSPHRGSHRGRENFSRSGGQVLGRQGGRGSGVTRPSWHQGGAFVPSPTGHQGSTNNRRLSTGVLRVARSLGVATASTLPLPWLEGGWWVLTWVSVKLSRACITDCSGLEAWDYKERDGRVTSEWV